jgi:hypothetical protein
MELLEPFLRKKEFIRRKRNKKKNEEKRTLFEVDTFYYGNVYQR